jgi:hypothetical protein
MKNLYARVVLWLIRPAVQRALREETRQGSVPTSAQMAALGRRIDTLTRVTPRVGRL